MMNYNELNINSFYEIAKYIKINGVNATNVNDLAEKLKIFLNGEYNFSEDVSKANTIFDSILDVIIVEILLNKESILVNYFKKSNRYVYYINTAINNRAISLGISLVNENSNTLNELLLFYIIAYSRNVPSDILDKISDLKGKAKEDENAKQHIVTKIEKLKNEKGELNKDVYFAVKKVLKSSGEWFLIAFISLSLMIKLGINIKFNTDIFTYDNFRGMQSTNEYVDNFYDDKETYVVRYEPWSSVNDGFEREYTAYDVSNFNYEDLANYLLLDLEKYDLKEITGTESKESLDESDLYESSYISVVQLSNQDLNDKKLTLVPLNSFKGIIVLLLILSFPFSLYFHLKSDKMKQSIKALKMAIINKEQYNEEEVRSDIKKLLDKYREYDLDITKIEKDLEDIYNKYSYLLGDSQLKSSILRRKR